MKYVIVSIIVGIVFGLGGYLYLNRHGPFVSPVSDVSVKLKPLEKYTIENLQNRKPGGEKLQLDEAVATESSYTVYRFHFLSEGKRVNGLAHIPTNSPPPFPVIIQLRGYVEQSIYQPGIGTKRSAQVYASAGYVSLAPDFLGYGDSDYPENNVFEERFQTYTTILDLLSLVGTLPFVDEKKIGLWGHSNGGHIALTILAITQKKYPTTLWAPVSKPFPYSILYYTDEAPDFGKALRKKLADFEETYDTDKFSVWQNLTFIQAPILLHQGSSDTAVPQSWSDSLVNILKSNNKEVTYHLYEAADHNMSGTTTSAWNTVVARDLNFFNSNFR